LIQRCTTLLAALWLVACSGDEPPLSTANRWQRYTAAQTVQALADELRRGDISEFVEGLLPPQHLDLWRARWEAWQQRVPPREIAQAYSKQVARWQSPEVEQALVTELTPQLRKLQQQLPRLLDVMHASIVVTLAQGQDPLSTAAQPVIRIFDRLFLWARNTDFGDPLLLRQGVHEVGSLLRDVNLPRLADVRALSFDAALRRSDRVWEAVTRILGIYNINLKGLLASLRVRQEEVHGSEAKIMIRVELLGVEHELELPLRRRGHRWYLESVLQGFVPSPSLDQRMGVAGQATR